MVPQLCPPPNNAHTLEISRSPDTDPRTIRGSCSWAWSGHRTSNLHCRCKALWHTRNCRVQMLRTVPHVGQVPQLQITMFNEFRREKQRKEHFMEWCCVGEDDHKTENKNEIVVSDKKKQVPSSRRQACRWHPPIRGRIFRAIITGPLIHISIRRLTN